MDGGHAQRICLDSFQYADSQTAYWKTMKKILVLFVLSVSTAVAQSMTLTQDAYVLPGIAANFGNTTTLSVGGPSSAQALVMFDLSPIPSGATGSIIGKAVLTLFANKIAAPGGINVSVANGPWNETTVTGLNGPSLGSTIASQFSVGTVPNNFMSIDVTEAVRSWINGTTNSGLLITPLGGVTISFDSKENTNTSHPPSLVIIMANSAGLCSDSQACSAGTAAGPQGIQGIQGLPGPAGPPGATGPAGVAAHEAARWVFQGVTQNGSSNMNMNVPETRGLNLGHHTGSVFASADAQFAPLQNTDFAWVPVDLPYWYAANQSLNFVLVTSCDPTAVCDSTHKTYIYLAVAAPGPDAVPFDNPFTEPSTPLTIVNKSGGRTTRTTGSLIPGVNGCPPTVKGAQQILIKIRGDLLAGGVSGMLMQSLTISLEPPQ
jgi:hypothetical protein